MKTKIKFSDIAGMLERDEMKEITGACGNACGSSSAWSGGGGGMAAISAGMTSAASMGFGGGTAIGSTFGGQPYAGYSNPIVNNFNSSSGSNNSSSSSYNSINSAISVRTISAVNHLSCSNGWSITANGLTTNDPKAIDRYFDFVYANKSAATTAQINTFINNEATAAGQQANNILLYGTVLNNVTVINNYHGPSTLPKGIVINNGATLYSSSPYAAAGGTIIKSTWDGLPIHGSAVKPTALEAAYLSKAVYGDAVTIEQLNGWSVSKAVTGLIYNDPASGFKSQLYEKTVNGKKEYCYVTAGTEASKADVAADVLQVAGLSRQYQESVNNAIALKKLFGDTLSFTGHSLGGGMAEANARATGDSATTFNAAGLSPATVLFLGLGSNSDTNAYIMKSDPLNALQLSSNLLNTAGGEKYYLSAASQSGSMNAHSIDSVIESLLHSK
jgi:hypothetical protein